MREKAFTLIELLVVVAIISVLSAIAIPNFLRAQTRAKVARVQADLRTLATALESYHSDRGEYPPVPIALPSRFRRFRPLTTPIAYITSIPGDPFKSIDPRAHGPLGSGMYGYGAMPLTGASRWILVSDGPDRRLNVDPLDIAFYPGIDVDFAFIDYDPSNGVVSIGDIDRRSDALSE